MKPIFNLFSPLLLWQISLSYLFQCSHYIILATSATLLFKSPFSIGAQAEHLSRKHNRKLVIQIGKPSRYLGPLSSQIFKHTATWQPLWVNLIVVCIFLYGYPNMQTRKSSYTVSWRVLELKHQCSSNKDEFKARNGKWPQNYSS